MFWSMGGSILRRLNKGSNNYFRVERSEDQKYVCVRRPLDWLFLATVLWSKRWVDLPSSEKIKFSLVTFFSGRVE